MHNKTLEKDRWKRKAGKSVGMIYLGEEKGGADKATGVVFNISPRPPEMGESGTRMSASQAEGTVTTGLGLRPINVYQSDASGRTTAEAL